MDEAVDVDAGPKRRGKKTAYVDMMEEGFDTQGEELLQKLLSDLLQNESKILS